jgi:hypothetical protein
MPRGPRGEKRPSDVIGAVVMVGKIASGSLKRRHPGGQGCAERDQQAPS